MARQDNQRGPIGLLIGTEASPEVVKIFDKHLGTAIAQGRTEIAIALVSGLTSLNKVENVTVTGCTISAGTEKHLHA